LGLVIRHLPRAALLAMSLALLACSSLIGLGDLDKAECADCELVNSGASMGGNGVAGSAPASGGIPGSAASGSGGYSGSASSNGGISGSPSVAGAPVMFPIGGDGNEGLGGAAPNLEVCPGGPEPPLTWTEDWFEHTEKLQRVYYDACIAMYFDAAVAPEAEDWLVPFLDAAWSYSLRTYGQVGDERLYVVVHQDKHYGGHSAIYGEASHGYRNVIDMGADSWPPGDYDLPSHLLAFVVDWAGAHSKFGAPQAHHYQNEGFPLIYKYDLYVALNLTNVATAALDYFNTLNNDEPAPGTYWFRDWFYPLWRDHGHAKVFANYMTLLDKHYPADVDHWMPFMTYGEYFHFMSGAAGEDLEPLAREAFEWQPEFDAELSAAKEDFSAIRY
jgi:hypothetical protein